VDKEFSGKQDLVPTKATVRRLFKQWVPRDHPDAVEHWCVDEKTGEYDAETKRIVKEAWEQYRQANKE